MLICLSGGIDSCTLLSVCVDVLGKFNVKAFVGNSAYMISSEINYAKSLCKELDVEVIEDDVGVSEIMLSNPPERCYLCKRNIFSHAVSIAKTLGVKYVLDGSNADDFNEHRLGERAKCEFNIKSPFAECGLNKEQVCKLARELGLNERVKIASATCLMTRFLTGTKVSLDNLRIVEEAETFIKTLGFKIVRVRNFNNRFEIQVGVDELQKISSPEILSKIKDYFHSQNIKNFTIARDGYKFGCMQKG